MTVKNMPKVFELLLSEACVDESNIIKTKDGFFMVHKSLSDILSKKNILDFLDSSGKRLLCNRFFDDWFLYAVPSNEDYAYSLLKLREQEQDAKEDSPADGDTPGVTVSFVSFDCGALLNCLADPSDENKSKLNFEINRTVAHKGQKHRKELKEYFKNPQSEGAYLIAESYVKHIAMYSENGSLATPKCYQEALQKSLSHKNSGKYSRLPNFVESLNRSAGKTVCDNEQIFIENPKEPSEYEFAAILATHTGNTSVYSFAAEVEYHARFLTPIAKIKLPLLGKSVYDSAIRADMTVGDTEFQGPAPFYRSNSKIVKRQYLLHKKAK